MTPPAANPLPMEKIELIQRSLSAFGFGLPGIVPFLGTPFAIVALVQNSRIKRRFRTSGIPRSVTCSGVQFARASA